LTATVVRTDKHAVDLGVEVDDALNSVCYSNEEGFHRILRLYARPGDTIVDPTYGNGRFWLLIDRSQYTVLATDLATHGVDLRHLPYEDGSADLVVLDPPYRYTPATNKRHEDTPGHGKVDGLYGLQAAQMPRTQHVIALYLAGMQEAKRVLKRGGFLIVKCMDTVQNTCNIWVARTLANEAESMGYVQRDLLIVRPASVTKTRWDYQRHLRKAHSYFLIFRRDGHFPFGAPVAPAQQRLKPVDGRPAQGVLDLTSCQT
jgi:hypothetical protein